MIKYGNTYHVDVVISSNSIEIAKETTIVREKLDVEELVENIHFNILDWENKEEEEEEEIEKRENEMKGDE